MRIEFDPAKSARNARSRGLSFDLAAGFDWESAVYREDSRRAYPEGRIVALGYVGPRLCVLCFTPSNRCSGIGFQASPRDQTICRRNHLPISPV